MNPSDFLNRCDSTVKPMFLKSEFLKDEKRYEELKEQLELLLEEHYENVKVHFFGSRIIGLADDESDLDIFIEIGRFLKLKK